MKTKEDLKNEFTTSKNYYSKYIEVCSECLRACCWYGEFMCDKADIAGTTIKTVKELKILNKDKESMPFGGEGEHYWQNTKLMEVYGNVAPFGYKKMVKRGNKAH